MDISSFDNVIDQAQAELDGKGHSMAWFISEPTPSSIVDTGHSSGTFSESSLSHDSLSSYTSSYASEYLSNDSLVAPMETISSQALATAPPPSQCVQAGRRHVCMHCPRRESPRFFCPPRMRYTYSFISHRLQNAMEPQDASRNASPR